MTALVGTSGYQYNAWRGHLYDAKCKESEMLSVYARALPTVEVNDTFYRMPTRAALTRWAAQVPATFKFAIKAPKRITHVLQLRDAGATLKALFTNLERLDDKLGCVLFQLPLFLHKNSARLAEFLKLLPVGQRVSIEFRHDSWHDAEVFDLLSKAGVALCTADWLATPVALQPTADFGYLRLRRCVYSDDELRALRERVRSQPWRDVYVYFKDEPEAPALAALLSALFERTGPGLARASEAPTGKAPATAAS